MHNYCIFVHYYFTDIILRFNQTTYRINENDGSFQPVLVLSNPSLTDLTIQVIDNEVSAISSLNGGFDYISGPYSITIPAGDTSVSFDITIIDDGVVEDNETFSLTIAPESLPYLVSRGNPGVAMVTIVSDDGKLCVLVKIAISHIMVKLVKNISFRSNLAICSLNLILATACTVLSRYELTKQL